MIAWFLSFSFSGEREKILRRSSFDVDITKHWPSPSAHNSLAKRYFYYLNFRHRHTTKRRADLGLSIGVSGRVQLLLKGILPKNIMRTEEGLHTLLLASAGFSPSATLSKVYIFSSVSLRHSVLVYIKSIWDLLNCFPCIQWF